MTRWERSCWPVACSVDGEPAGSREGVRQVDRPGGHEATFLRKLVDAACAPVKHIHVALSTNGNADGIGEVKGRARQRCSYAAVIGERRQRCRPGHEAKKGEQEQRA